MNVTHNFTPNLASSSYRTEIDEELTDMEFAAIEFRKRISEEGKAYHLTIAAANTAVKH